MAGMFKNRTFHFSQERTVISILAALLCYAMCYWQYTRYVGKRAYFGEVETQARLGVQRLDPAADDLEAMRYAIVQVAGEFDYEREVVLTNRSKDSAPGVRVVTPLKIEGSETRILVDRGFLPYRLYAEKRHGDYRPAGRQEVEGMLRPSHRKAFFLAPSTPEPKSGEWRERWIRLEIEKMAAQLPYEPAPMFIEQRNQGEGYPVYDPKTVVSAGRHLNYTIQWASFGTFSIFLGLFLQFRPKKPRRASAEDPGAQASI